MPVRVGINGFGRIGRNVFRAAHEAGADIEWVAVNDLTDAATLAHLTKYDSVYGPLPGRRRGHRRRAARRRVRGQGPGRARPRRAALGRPRRRRRHRVDRLLHEARRPPPSTSTAGAKKVIISAPANGAGRHRRPGRELRRSYDPAQHHVISNASCTTNCLAPFAKVVHDAIGIRHGLMTTIHAYTGDQRLVDAPHSDLRRARAAAINLIPTSTGAAKAVGLVLPELNGKLHGFAIRAPVPTGSVVDLTFEAARETSVDEVNAALRAAGRGRAAGDPALHRGPDRLDRHPRGPPLVDRRRRS